MNKRHVSIIEYLTEEQIATVASLAEMTGVSKVTIRKDLNYLEEQGLISRIHGFAKVNDSNDVNSRMTRCFSIKQRIAKNVASTIKDGETIMIGAGSCCAFLAKELIEEQKDILIITNSVYIAGLATDSTNPKIALLGGFYQPETQALFGPVTKKSSDIFSPDKYFIGTDGFLPNFGFSGSDHSYVQTVMDLVKRAKNVFILTESKKFRHQGDIGMVSFNELTGVYTDTGITASAERILKKEKVLLVKVPAKEK